jgi:hypothetical protein
MDSNKHTCSICLGEFAAEQGILCNGDKRHFICGSRDVQGCFHEYVRRCCSAEECGSFTRAGCRLYCPLRPCSAAEPAAGTIAEDGVPLHFTDTQISALGGNGLLSMYESARAAAYMEQGYTRAQEEAQQQQQLAAARQQQQEQEHERVQCTRNAIINECLTLTVPCCRRGIIQDGLWNGCLAIHCAYCCASYFCALCLAATGGSADMHIHAHSCRLRQPVAGGTPQRRHGGSFARPGELAAARAQLYTERLDAALQRYGQQPQLLGRLLDALEGDLQGLGLRTDRWRAWLPASSARQPAAAAAALAGGIHAYGRDFSRGVVPGGDATGPGYPDDDYRLLCERDRLDEMNVEDARLQLALLAAADDQEAAQALAQAPPLPAAAAVRPSRRQAAAAAGVSAAAAAAAMEEAAADGEDNWPVVPWPDLQLAGTSLQLQPPQQQPPQQQPPQQQPQPQPQPRPTRPRRPRAQQLPSMPQQWQHQALEAEAQAAGGPQRPPVRAYLLAAGGVLAALLLPGPTQLVMMRLGVGGMVGAMLLADRRATG